MTNALARFDEHIQNFDFKTSLEEHGKSLLPDMDNLVNILTLDQSNVNIENQSHCEEPSKLDSDIININSDGIAEELDGRLKGVHVSNNVLNLSRRKLSKSEISLLSKGLKFVPTPSSVDRSAIKHELETFGRRLRLSWHFRKDEQTFDYNPFKTKSILTPEIKMLLKRYI